MLRKRSERTMMNRILPLVAALAAIPLAACQSEPETVTSVAPDPLADQKAAAEPVELPPAIRAQVTFRCRDNSLVYVDFFTGDEQVNLRNERGTPPTTLTTETPGGPYTAEGYSLSGDPENITLKQPGKDELTCRA